MAADYNSRFPAVRDNPFETQPQLMVHSLAGLHFCTNVGANKVGGDP